MRCTADAQRPRIQNVLKHRDAEHQVELVACVEPREILSVELATLGNTLVSRAAPRFARSSWGSGRCP